MNRRTFIQGLVPSAAALVAGRSLHVAAAPHPEQWPEHVMTRRHPAIAFNKLPPFVRSQGLEPDETNA